MFYGKSRNFKDPELANSEVSEQTKRSRNFANSLSRDVFESPIFKFHVSARGERVKPALGAVSVATPQEIPCVAAISARRAAGYQAADLPSRRNSSQDERSWEKSHADEVHKFTDVGQM